MGTKEKAKEIKSRIQEFLKTELNLHLNEEKTKITHMGTQKAMFLGVQIGCLKPKESMHIKVNTTGNVKKRASHVRIRLEAPYQRILEKLKEKGFITIKEGKYNPQAISK
jgi:hypothetical protein